MTDRLGRRRSIARPLPPKQAPFSKRAYQSSAAEPGGIWEPILSTQEWNRLRPDLDLNPVSTGDAEPHSDDVWRGTAGGPATKALGDMNAVKAALPL
jgi:hypothetical protein